jgi:hypothetical protein
MHVSKITIGRLYNLGSYEHVRYEITCEVPEGQSAATALIGMEKLLCALNPKRPCGVPSREETERAANTIATMKALSDEDFKSHHNYGGAKGSRKEITKLYEKDLAEGLANLKAWEARSKKARQMLKDVGGAAVWKDAKLDWDNDEY